MPLLVEFGDGLEFATLPSVQPGSAGSATDWRDDGTRELIVFVCLLGDTGAVVYRVRRFIEELSSDFLRRLVVGLEKDYETLAELSPLGSFDVKIRPNRSRPRRTMRFTLVPNK